MALRINITALAFLCAILTAHFSHAVTAERVAVEAGVRAEVGKDLALPYPAKAGPCPAKKGEKYGQCEDNRSNEGSFIPYYSTHNKLCSE
jgi:hypothetical protein